MHNTFKPQFVSVFHEGYRFSTFVGDLNAGIITGIVAMPLAIAFAIASGVTPAQGFYTAIIAGLIISLLSGSKVQIGGPTGAFVIMVYSIVQQFGIQGLMLATIIAGILLILMGIMRLGSFIKYIPYPVTQGFTSGIALAIASTQIKPLLGLKIDSIPCEFIPKIACCVKNISSYDTSTVTLSLITIAILYFWPKISNKIPGSIIAIIFSTIIAKIFDLPVATIGSEFGEVSSTLPGFNAPEVSFKIIQQVFPAAISIAMLGAIESLLSAVVADGMTGEKHRSNMELIAQGTANIICPFWGGIPATGAIARTATNIKSGGKTPIAGIIHAAVLLSIMLCLGSLASLIPLCVLAGILLAVALGMSEYKLFIKMFSAPKSDILVMLTTFLLTVLLDLTIAIPAGMILACLLFMRRMEQICDAKEICPDEADMDDERCDPFALNKFSIPPQVVVYEINGPFFFGAASKFQDDLIKPDAKIFILRMRSVPAMDATGLFALEKIVKRAKHNKRKIIISGINDQPLSVLKKSGLINIIGPESIHRNISTALTYANSILKKGSSL